MHAVMYIKGLGHKKSWYKALSAEETEENIEELDRIFGDILESNSASRIQVGSGLLLRCQSRSFYLSHVSAARRTDRVGWVRRSVIPVIHWHKKF
jgi:hypothetical protein